MTTFFILLVLWAVMVSILGIIMIKMFVELYQQVKKQPIAVKETQQEDIKPKPIKKNVTKRIRKSPKKV
jgi:hypothetical protein